MDSDNLPVPTANQIVPGVTGDQSLLRVSRPQIVTSLDMEDESARRLLTKALTDEDMSGREGVNLVMHVRDFVLRTSQRTNMTTKELEPCLRLSLITEAGDVWSTTSRWAIESFHLICGLTSYPPWRPGRSLRVKTVKTSGGYETYRLVDTFGNI